MASKKSNITREHIDHCTLIVDRVIQRMHAKYMEGVAEHGGNIWDKPGMIEHAIDECIDCLVYLYTEKFNRDKVESS